MRRASALALLLPLAASAQDAAQGRELYETHCGACHYERVHQRMRSSVRDLADLRDTVARWSRQTKRTYTLDELENIVQYLNESHYRFGLSPAERRELIYGAELMSEQEREQYRSSIAGAKTPDARAQRRAQHRERMRERARERGAELTEPAGTVKR